MITPNDNDLGEIAQSEDFLISFNVDLDVGETIDSVEITSSEPTDSVIISESPNNASISGNYGQQFNPEPNSLTYRDSITGEIQTVDDWDELPDRNEAELTSWDAPEEITKTIMYTVVFNISGTNNRQETKEYIHTVYGDYSIWGNQLRNYVGNS
tara:strand:- start:7339 stop:7803 length:465 start_codon:yes stop_codon:yes gene_type:complete